MLSLSLTDSFSRLFGEEEAFMSNYIGMAQSI